jgi:hypothetical protein
VSALLRETGDGKPPPVRLRAECNRCTCLACTAQAEKDLCDPTALEGCNVTAYQAKYPTAIDQPTCTGTVTAGGADCATVAEFVAAKTAATCPAGCTFGGVVTSDPLTTVATSLDLKPKSWTFLTATVGANVDMYNAKYSVGAARVVLS